MKKTVNKSNIYLSIVNETANFKMRLPQFWCKEIGINEKEKEICISIEDDKLVIKKATNKLFLKLDKKEKALQIKKYELMNGYKHTKKELIEEMEEYYQVSYRTIYRLLKEEVDLEELENVKLLDKQDPLERNVNVILSNYKNSIIYTVSIPTNLAMIFLRGKTYDELGIKTAVEIYNENTKIAIEMELLDNKIVIERA